MTDLFCNEAGVLFSEWLIAVDDILTARTGLDRESHPDWIWRDAFDSETAPEDAVREFLADEYGNEFPNFGET